MSGPDAPEDPPPPAPPVRADDPGTTGGSSSASSITKRRARARKGITSTVLSGQPLAGAAGVSRTAPNAATTGGAGAKLGSGSVFQQAFGALRNRNNL